MEAEETTPYRTPPNTVGRTATGGSSARSPCTSAGSLHGGAPYEGATAPTTRMPRMELPLALDEDENEQGLHSYCI